MDYADIVDFNFNCCLLILLFVALSVSLLEIQSLQMVQFGLMCLDLAESVDNIIFYNHHKINSIHIDLFTWFMLTSD
jgi:hypothetical protein